ncbi:MAG: hypothetical protein M3R53_03250, partial [Candidatus Eremiobacteraeota bacterium]|nr:hypothetical protein [Candidatus Eremiobacteraeota bacterium]
VHDVRARNEYRRTVCLTRSPASQSWRPGAVRMFALVALAWLGATGAVRAETTTFEALEAPIVRINVRATDVTIRTWDRAAVSIEGSPALVLERKMVQVSTAQIPLFVPGAGSGRGDGREALPPESFVVSSIPSGPREQVVVKMPLGWQSGGTPALPLIVTVPADAVFVSARTGGGNLDVHDYRGGTFVGFAGGGRLSLYGAGGTAFVQTGRGPLRISDSSFERLRARSLSGNMTFERCRVRQIEATSVDGSLVFDGGNFEPGLARFETTRGDVAVGTSGPAQIAGHAAGAGRVFTSFERGARVDGSDGASTAVVAGGGPLVTANTQAGNVFLYDGSLHNRRAILPSAWQSPLGTLQHPAERSVGSQMAASREPVSYPRAHRFRRKPPTSPRKDATPTPMRSGARPPGNYP